MLMKRTLRRMFCTNSPADASDACENIAGDSRVVAPAPYDFKRWFVAHVCLSVFCTLLWILVSPPAAAEPTLTIVPLVGETASPLLIMAVETTSATGTV